jgi:hypothetical protein
MHVRAPNLDPRRPPMKSIIRTTNLLERLFLEERHRTKIIPHAFGERPVLKLMWAAVIRAADWWRGMTVGEFEQRQLRAIREELNRAHALRVAPFTPLDRPERPFNQGVGGFDPTTAHHVVSQTAPPVATSSSGSAYPWCCDRGWS